MPENVQCRSDSTYGERPVAFTWQAERLNVASIVQRWRSPAGKGFQVSTSERRIFELFYYENQDEWIICEI